MTSIALVIAFLAGHHFQTACVQTQDNGKSGYAVDSIDFMTGGKLRENELAVTFTRTMYASPDCQSDEGEVSSQSGRVSLAPKSDGFFTTQDGEERFDADWLINTGKGDQKELGAIGINVENKTLRIARNTPGFFRNTMLQFIAFKGTSLEN